MAENNPEMREFMLVVYRALMMVADWIADHYHLRRKK
jgi:hypothetical protein